jgi:hypothetical protein
MLQPQPLHLTEGSLMLYYDQMNVIAAHLRQAYPDKYNPSQNRQEHSSVNQVLDTGPAHDSFQSTSIGTNMPAEQDLGKSFTLRELKKRDDWDEWRKARYAMLNSYHDQGMFSKPMEVPDKANVHYMLWRYMFNMCGTRKARMVCDRSSRQGTITLGHTFANSLDAASERLFWAVVANKGLTTYGADVSNAFTEAPPPIHPLYMRIDEAFCDWWENCLQRPPIPPNHTVIVQNAIQGHPESPRLWEKLIDKIL